MIGKYAVLRATNASGGEMRFTKVYDDLNEARNEAARLCGKEGAPFLVVEIISRCDPKHEVIWS